MQGRRVFPRVMNFARTLRSVAAVTTIFVAGLLLHGQPAHGIAIQDTPTVIADPAADISDVYLFPSPTNSSNVVAVMDVFPGAPAGSNALNTYFDQKVLYQMKFDRKYPTVEAQGVGPIEDLVLQFSVGVPGNNSQQIIFYGANTPNQTGTSDTLLNGGVAVASGAINTTFSGGSGITIFAGARSDPYFFDQSQYDAIFPDRNRGSTAASCLPTFGNGTCPNGFNDPGSDFFASTNVLSIVVEMPKTLLIPTGGALGKVAYWATTSMSSGN